MNRLLVAGCVFTLFFHSLEGRQGGLQPSMEQHLGGIIRADKNQKLISLVFTGHEFADGGETIRAALKHHGIKASFFFTGDFYRNPRFGTLIAHLIDDGHYLGAHSDRHLLYCSWEKRDSLLVSKTEFFNDLANNYIELDRFCIARENALYFMPPYEWYNEQISAWCREFGLTLINFTPGTSSNADYTTPDMGRQYVSSDTIYHRILRYEETHKDGLNGFILLLHIGTHPGRTDKFHSKLDALLTELEQRGYRFARIDESLKSH
jgi:endoglucanase